jgi:hypothetical protein
VIFATLAGPRRQRTPLLRERPERTERSTRRAHEAAIVALLDRAVDIRQAGPRHTD